MTGPFVFFVKNQHWVPLRHQEPKTADSKVLLALTEHHMEHHSAISFVWTKAPGANFYVHIRFSLKPGRPVHYRFSARWGTPPRIRVASAHSAQKMFVSWLMTLYPAAYRVFTTL